MSSLKSKAFDCAVRLLAGREHSAYELSQKLAYRHYVDDEIILVLAECQRLGMQSDMRYAESLCRTRQSQGYGPLRIRHDLHQKQIADEYIEQVLESVDWEVRAMTVWRKKYKQSLGLSWALLQKQKQFLVYRGFSTDTILACQRLLELFEQES